MCACRACAGYRGVTWRTSRPWATPEETLTFCAATLGSATRMSLTMLITLFGTALGKPPGTEPGTPVAPLGGASSLLTMATFFGTVIGERNPASWDSLVGFAGGAFEGGLGATL